MTQVSPIIGFKGKPSITEAWPHYRFHFRALAAVHDLGRSKYAAFSWQNNPNASNSTIENNIDALMRHITLHKAGHPQDSEGFPHIYHIACRIGMLLTTWYRQIYWGEPTLDRPDTFTDCGKVLAEYMNASSTTFYDEDTSPWLATLHITPEEIISCLKMYIGNGIKIRNVIDATSSTYSQYPERYITYVLDNMHLQLMTLLQTTMSEYSDYKGVISKEAPNADEVQLLENRRHHYFHHITPCDILQYLSAILLNYVHVGTSADGLIHLTRSNAQIAELVANYKKGV